MTFPTFLKQALTVWPVAAVDTDKVDVRAWGLTVETALNALFSSFAMINGQLKASVAGNVLTIEIRTHLDVAPSSADPTYVAFRGLTEAGGDEDLVKLTTTTTLTISAGSTLGGVDTEAQRFWIVAFNNGGSIVLGAINVLEAGAILHPLVEGVLNSSTAEGGAGGADTAGVLYSTAAVTSKPMRILGYLTWEANALATAGLYASPPDVVQLMGPGVNRPGDIVQRVRTTNGALDTTATTTPVNDTIPQLSTEGETQLTQAITPTSRANLIDIRADVQLALSAAGDVVCALHQDSIEDALTAKHAAIAAADESATIHLTHQVKALAVAARTYKINNGPSTGTLTLNGVAGVRTFGGINLSSLEALEIFA